MAGRLVLKIPKGSKPLKFKKRGTSGHGGIQTDQSKMADQGREEDEVEVAEAAEEEAEQPDSGWERHFNAGKVLESEGKYWEALAKFRRAEMLNSGNIEVMNHLAGALYMIGRCDEAQGIFRRILDQDPENIEVLVRLANTYESQQDYFSAMITYRQAVGVLTGSNFK